MTRQHDQRLRDDQDMVICPIDKQRVIDHLKCAVCTILIGPGHHERESRVITGKVHCLDCVARQAAKQRNALAGRLADRTDPTPQTDEAD